MLSEVACCIVLTGVHVPVFVVFRVVAKYRDRIAVFSLCVRKKMSSRRRRRARKKMHEEAAAGASAPTVKPQAQQVCYFSQF